MYGSGDRIETSITSYKTSRQIPFSLKKAAGK